MNENNVLNLKQGSWGRVLVLAQGKGSKNITVFMPCQKRLANARVLEAFDDGAITAHWESNFNTNGDFRTELMRFDNNLVLDALHLAERNRIRRDAGLVEID